MRSSGPGLADRASRARFGAGSVLPRRDRSPGCRGRCRSPLGRDVPLVAGLALTRAWPGRGGVRVRVGVEEVAVDGPPAARARRRWRLRAAGSPSLFGPSGGSKTMNRCQVPMPSPLLRAGSARCGAGASRSCRRVCAGATNRSVGVEEVEDLVEAVDAGARRRGRREGLAAPRRSARAGRSAPGSPAARSAPVSSADAIVRRVLPQRLRSRAQLGEQRGAVAEEGPDPRQRPVQSVERRRASRRSSPG